MKKEDQPSMSWVPENQASFIAGRGWKSSNCSSLPVEGQKFSLTFPFIEQAFAFDRWSTSDVAMWHQLITQT